jgi:hypothetical protein
MAFIPKGTAWYVAQVILEITVEGEVRNIVHINYLLVKAESPEEAYEKAMRLGTEHESRYLNRDKKIVSISFRGLRNLTAVYDNVDDGAELFYEEHVGVSPQALDALIRAKESLGVFRPIERSSGPDYASEEIWREAQEMIEKGTQP